MTSSPGICGNNGRQLGAAAPATKSSWPKMTPSDAQRFAHVFSQVDTDHDGKITGEQARQLFLSWQLPRGVLTIPFSSSLFLQNIPLVAICLLEGLLDFYNHE
jgi:hypothetical protein